MSLPMLGHQLVIVSDAHLGAGGPAIEEAMLDFLRSVPDLGDGLLINGDLFDFWFAYRQVVPRRGFRIASALADLRRKVPIAMTGGNHDRWGDSFWDRELDIPFGADGLRFRAAGTTALAVHGDGLTEQHRSARFMHRLTRNQAGLALFRAIPPDISFRLVDRLSGHLADATRDPGVLDRAAVAQQAWATAALEAEPGLGLIVMGHTHRPAVSEPFPARRYCNPGAWMEGYRYAIARPDGIELRQFSA